MFQTLDTFDTIFSADSVEWCPVEGLQDVFVCGTYQLPLGGIEGLTTSNEPEKKKRIGKIYLFRMVDDGKLKLLQKLDTPAILDMKWQRGKCWDAKVLLGAVNSEGFLQIYELVREDEGARIILRLVSETLVNESGNGVLALSMDWSTGKGNDADNTDIKITVSDSRGSISLLRLGKGGGDIEKIFFWNAHEYEAWITAFDYWNTNVIYTGGDDCKFLRFDTRVDPIRPTNTNRSHDAGVTSLHCSWKREFCLVSGSYDESLRTWDSRNLRRPLGELGLNGGVWRLKWDPHESEHLLAACMYNGFAVVECGDRPDRPRIVAEYKEHESIAYGCDWSSCTSEGKGKESRFVGTCSFYDHALKLSSVKL